MSLMPGQTVDAIATFSLSRNGWVWGRTGSDAGVAAGHLSKANARLAGEARAY